MSEAKVEKMVCGSCGVDVRDGTAFCYNCGSSVAGTPAVDTATAKVEASEPKKDEVAADDKLTRAADQRRKARVSQRRSNEYVWEPVDDSRFTLLIAILITVIAFGVVFLTVFWK